MTEFVFHSLAFEAPEDLQIGIRARRLARLAGSGLPVPQAVALDYAAVRALANGAEAPPLPQAIGPIVSIRSSPGDAAWGGPPAMLNIGLTDANLPDLASRIGEVAAWEVYRRLIQTFGTQVCGLDAEAFDNLYYDQLKLSPQPGAADLKALVGEIKALFADETGAPFPQCPVAQLAAGLSAMARDWSAPTTVLLREAKGAPRDAGLGLIVQNMVFGLGQNSGAGLFQPIESQTGAAAATGRFLPDAQGQDVQRGMRTPHLITRAEREAAGQTQPSLEEIAPEIAAALPGMADRVARLFADRMALGFTVSNGELALLDAWPVRRSPAGAIRIAVDLAEGGIISRDDAILRIEPRTLSEILHPQIDRDARRDVVGRGLAASPGAASGKICFSSEAAQALHAQGEASILVRVETSTEDIRGMHVTAAVLTVRGGMTSHAAVIARGLGVPCVVGASDLSLELAKKRLTTSDGRVFREGDQITIDGTHGQALAGAVRMRPAEVSETFETLMGWADDRRQLGVRANADTPQDAEVARRFKVDGIGLCRTEHTFFEGDRVDRMCEMILADSPTARQKALDTLLPLHRRDFEQVFEIMRGLPVTIRLLDPPLHEFLPNAESAITRLARSMGLAVDVVVARIDELKEFNPMLGKRGVRLGITMPEIYDMQARAIFEAAHAVGQRSGTSIVPEIMIPLVSANREVELVKSRVEAVAKAVSAEQGAEVAYRIGVMVETPRGALRSGDLAKSSAFLSFGTNDLTQMAYGLSRDDAGRFMRDYVEKGVFPEDPFHTLDLEGVGELILLAARRGRDQNPELTLGLCGEHGGDPASIRFCQLAGFDYVSCSPFRVPVARLAAAQAAILTSVEEAESLPEVANLDPTAMAT